MSPPIKRNLCCAQSCPPHSKLWPGQAIKPSRNPAGSAGTANDRQHRHPGNHRHYRGHRSPSDLATKPTEIENLALGPNAQAAAGGHGCQIRALRIEPLFVMALQRCGRRTQDMRANRHRSAERGGEKGGQGKGAAGCKTRSTAAAMVSCHAAEPHGSNGNADKRSFPTSAHLAAQHDFHQSWPKMPAARPVTYASTRVYAIARSYRRGS